MSKRAQQFEVALKRLCREYNIAVSISNDAEALVLHNLRPGQEALEAIIQDNTTEGRD